MAGRIRLRKLIFWGLVLVLAILAGGIGFAYTYVTDGATLAELVRDESPRFFPGSILQVARVQARPFWGQVTLGQVQLLQQVDGRPFVAAHIPWLNIHHDAWALLHGRFEPSEVVVAQPTLQLRRRKDGTWNLEGLLADPWPAPQLPSEPVVRIRNGTVKLVEDGADNPAVILRDVALTVEPMGSGVLRFEGSARGDVFGQLRLEGTVDRRSGRIELTKGDLTHLAITETLRRRLPPGLQQKWDRARLSGGEVDVVLKRLVYDARAEPALSYAAGFSLRGAVLSCPQLPFTFDRVDAEASVRDSVLRIDRASGHNGKTTATLTGRLSADDPATGPMDLTIDVTQLELDDRLRAWSPQFAATWREFRPRGWVDLGVRIVRRRAGETPGFGLTVNCQDVGMTYHLFPYPIEHVRGTLKWQGPTIAVDMRTVVDGEWLTAKGTIDDPGPLAVVKLDFAAGRLPIDMALLDALPRDIRAVVDQFHPTGSVRGTAEVRRTPPVPGGKDDVRIVAKIDLNRGCAMRWDGLPYPVSDMTGHLEVYPDRWIFRDMKGRNGTAVIEADGTVEQVAPGVPKVTLKLKADRLSFDEQLRSALPKKWQDSWDLLRPSGSSRVEAAVQVQPGREEHYHLRVVPGPETRVHLTLTPVPGTVGTGPGRLAPIKLPPMENIDGAFVFDDDTVTMSDVKFLFREAPVRLRTGTVTLRDGGSFRLRVDDLEVSKLRLDSSLREIMPPVMAQFAQYLDDGRTFGVRTNLAIGWDGRAGEPARVEWSNATIVFDGNTIRTGLPMRNIQGQAQKVWGWSDGKAIEVHGMLDIDSVELLGQQVTRLTAPVHVAEGWARMPEIRGKLLGGNIAGSSAISLSATPEYQTELSLRDADLVEYARTVHGHQDVRGKVSVDLKFKGLGTNLATLEGSGRATMAEGNLGQLPIVLRFLKIPNRRPATKTAFDSASVEIAIEGGHARLDPIKFTGDAFSLQGAGEINLGGDREINLRLVPLFGRDEWHIPIVSDASREASRRLFDIHVFGPIAAPTIRTEPLPVVMPRASELVRRLGGRRMGRGEKEADR